MLGKLASVMVTLLLLTACGGGASVEATSSATPSATKATAETSPKPSKSAEPKVLEEKVSCVRLVKTGEGPLVRSVKLVEVYRLDKAAWGLISSRDEARRLSDTLQKIAGESEAHVAELIATVRTPVEEIATVGRKYELEHASFEKAATELLEICGQEYSSVTASAAKDSAAATPKPSASTPTATSAPSPTATPSAQPYPEQVVTYVLESDGTIDGATYTHMTVRGTVTQEQDTNPTFGKLEKTYKFGYFDLNGSEYSAYSLGVGSFSGADATTITCKILLNGTVVNEQTSTGPNAWVMCNHGG